METVVRLIWLIIAAIGGAGICLGAARIFESIYLFVTARGNGQQIAEAKSIFWDSVMGMALILGTYVVMILLQFD
jgi:hypothetical protein